jgi:LytS/YehU family sensor histidine kinase
MCINTTHHKGHLLRLSNHLDAVDTHLALQPSQHAHIQIRRVLLRHRQHAVAQVLQHLPEVLAVSVDEDAAVLAPIHGVAPAEVGVEERVWDAPHRLH